MRERVTAVVIREGRILLVRDHDKTKYSLPGGEMRSKELPLCCAIRELYEELGMQAQQAKYLPACNCRGSVNLHHVCRIETDDEPSIQSNELDSFLWWDMVSKVALYPHVDKIIEKLKTTKNLVWEKGIST